MTPSAETPQPSAGETSSARSSNPSPSLSSGPATPEKPALWPLVPMRNFVLFPHVLAPITVGRPRSVAAVREALAGGERLVVVLQRNADDEAPDLAGLREVGTLAKVIHDREGANDQLHIACLGERRVKVTGVIERDGSLWVEGYALEPELGPEGKVPLSPEHEALAMQLQEVGQEILSLLPGVPGELSQVLRSHVTATHLADLMASLLDIDAEAKQDLLEMIDESKRLRRILELASHRLQVLRLSQEIGARTREQIDERQRRALLQEQLRTIKHELGENGEAAAELQRLEQALNDAGLSAEARQAVDKELHRLKMMGEGSSEAALLRTWLDWVSELPWKTPAPSTVNLEQARRVLEADHYGLPKIKQRILEHLAVRKLNPEGRSPILCLVGPPGVGKTSLGQSIARAIGRPFARVALGGVHDEADIRGHRRTYIGALPGLILQALKQAGARDAVIMLDEVDKLSHSSRGDPSSALLEVLDPQQNHQFRDHYLGLPFDLSRVMFIATANVFDQIPYALRDRLETLPLSGYTTDEKLHIADHYLVKRQRESCGLTERDVTLAPDVLKSLIDHYTREAGVRQLEREIGRLCRHAAMQVAQRVLPVTITAEAPAGAAPAELVDETGPRPEQTAHIEAEDLERLLGPAPFEHEAALVQGLPGVATGLAWTPTGGDILFIEASRTPGRDKLILTGQLGDVMKESAQAALTLVKSLAPALGIPQSAFEQVDVHLHVPAGAIPKDGPSAGLAMFLCLASLFAQRPVRPDLAITGEISLRGRVLPVGGIKDKVLAALRAGVRTVILPDRNLKDLQDVPTADQAKLQFLAVDRVEDALAAALLERRNGIAHHTGALAPLSTTASALPIIASAPHGANDTGPVVL
jgi:ATP-dependent Lon protease